MQILNFIKAHPNISCTEASKFDTLVTDNMSYSNPPIYWAPIYRVPRYNVPLCVPLISCFAIEHVLTFSRFTVHFRFPPKSTVNRGITVYILHVCNNLGFGMLAIYILYIIFCYILKNFKPKIDFISCWSQKYVHDLICRQGSYFLTCCDDFTSNNFSTCILLQILLEWILQAANPLGF